MILTIGYGNSLYGDDGVGPYAVEQLAKADAELPDNTEFLVMRQLTPELVELISRADAVIFVDAADGEIPAGITCRELTVEDMPSDQNPGVFTHHVEPAALLQGARFLYGRHPRAYLYTVKGETFKLGDSFSPQVESALPSLLDQLKARIAQCMNLA
jgi:hydrogenase maturation protease